MKNKKEKFLYKNRYIIASFFATCGLMLVMYMILGLTPFGKNTILRMDLYHQYGPLFAELYDKLMAHKSFSYSWISGLGTCFLGNYFNYLSSPIGAIVIFFGHAHVPQAIAVMILIKAALSSATMTYYLKKSQHNQSAITVMFGILYAFCAYMLAYYWNVMWLDAMALFPLIILGIERIINNGKFALYTGALALSMFSNYYMSFMLCMFAVVYFFYYYIANYPGKAVISEQYKLSHPKGIVHKFRNRRFLRSGIIFAFASLLAAGLIAFALLPTYKVLQSCSATGNNFPDEMKTYFNSFDFLVNHFASLSTTIRSSGDDVLPNVYCGVLTLILAPLYFFTKSISKKEKLTTLGLLSFFYVSFNFNFLNFIWHGLHFPNDLPYRFSFMYSFILIVIAYKTFMRLNEFTSRQIGVVGAAIVLIAFLTEKIQSKNFTQGSLYISVAFVVLYVVMLTVFKSKKYEIASLAVLLCVCACSEVIIADTSSIPCNVEYESYASDYDEFRGLKSKLDTIEKDGFYRMELTDLRTRMDPCWYNYNGVSVFSSMANEKLSLLQDHLGMMSNKINSYTYNPQTPVYNMMHSLKYIVNNETPNVLSSAYYKEVTSTDHFTAYKNKYYLPIAFCVDTDVNDWQYIEDKNVIVNPFEVQGDFFEKATGVKNPFEKLSISYISYNNTDAFTDDIDNGVYAYNKTVADADASATFSITTEKKGNVYIYYHVDGASEKDITVNSSVGTIVHAADRDCLLDLGRYKSGETISINVPFEKNSGNMRLYVYTINDDRLYEGYEKLSNQSLMIDRFEDTYISGSFTAKNDCVLYTSIPYDTSWSIKIDGEPVKSDDILEIGGAFIGVNVAKGNHDVTFEYTPAGVSTGIKITVFTALILLAYILICHMKKRRSKPSKRPAFSDVDNSYTEDVMYAEIAVKTAVEQAISDKRKSNGLPEREVFCPPENQSYVKKEVFYPNESIQPNSFMVTDDIIEGQNDSENQQ